MTLLPLRLMPGTDLLEALAQLPREHGMTAGVVISGIGSLGPARLRLAGQPEAITLAGDQEILTLAGTLSPDGAHLHLSLADGEGRVRGGHLAAGSLVRTTAEVLVAWLPAWSFERRHDPQTGHRELQITAKDPAEAVDP